MAIRWWFMEDGNVVDLLGPALAGELRAAPFTYAEVGGTARDRLPSGYHHLEQSRAIPGEAFGVAGEGLMTWQIHEAAGLRVSASSGRVEPDAVVEMFLGPPRLRIRAVCRVVYVVNEPDRVGFAYGTLPGHAESGEESFVIERHGDAARFVVRAFSNPATALTKLTGPVSRRVQVAMARRYLRAATPTGRAWGGPC